MLRWCALIAAVAAVMLCGCGGGSGSGPEGETIYVDADAPEGGDGSEDRPLNDLQAAANLAQSGDVIHLAAGTYVPAGGEPVTILKPASVEGEGSGSTIIEGSLSFDARDPGVIVEVSDLAAETIAFAEDAPTLSPLVVSDCQLDGFREAGGDRVHRLAIQDTAIAGEVRLVYGNGASQDTFRDCTIAGQVTLAMGGGAQVEFSDCELAGGLADSSGASAVRILNCDFAGATVASTGNAPSPGGVAIVVEGCTGLTGVDLNCQGAHLTANTIHGAVRLTSSSPTEVTYNTIIGTAKTGIGLSTSAGAGALANNTISGFELGLQDTSGANPVAGNLIHSCVRGAIVRGLGEYRSNTFRDCDDWGVYARQAGGAIHHNTITGNGGDGVVIAGEADLGGGAENSPGGNVIRGNGGFDLRVEALAADLPTVYAQHNLWDHATEGEVGAQDVYDATDNASLASVVLAPLGAP